MPAWGRVVIAAAVVLTGVLVLLIVAGTVFPDAVLGGIGAAGAEPAAAGSAWH
jgi:hypothetical protein